VFATPPAFSFVDHGPLVDGELELVPPQPRWIDEFLAAVRHPLTAGQFPREARLSREEVERFVAEHPGGRNAGIPGALVPSYQFWMMIRHAPGRPTAAPPLRIAGGVSLRIGETPSIELYYGHIGYHVFPAAQGNRYALRASSLVLPIARAHGFRSLWLTCSPENTASRRTIERLGGIYAGAVAVPPGEPLFERGETTKSRFRLDL
jgi:predicted acetyltransferase